MNNFLPDMFYKQLRDLGQKLAVSKHIKSQVANVVLKHIGVERKFNEVFKHFWRRDLKGLKEHSGSLSIAICHEEE